MFPLCLFCALVDGDTYARGVRRASAALLDAPMAKSPEAGHAQREMPRFVARIACDVAVIGGNSCNKAGQRQLRKRSADGVYDLGGDIEKVVGTAEGIGLH